MEVKSVLVRFFPFVTPDDRGQHIVNKLRKKFRGLGKNYPEVKLGWLTVGQEV
jgi:hypothetical protein